jgi:hypothetical protein
MGADVELIVLATWQVILWGLLLVTAAVLLTVWWRQQSLRWVIVLAGCMVAALALNWWSSFAFEVADYRAGCDGLCPGFRGAPVPTFRGETAGGKLMPAGFALNSVVYLVLLLGWAAVVRAILRRPADGSRRSLAAQMVLGMMLFVGPFLLAPLYLPPPEAHVRGDPQRIAINARREVFMYDQAASAPVLRVGLEDVRPRVDSEPGMRVCFTTYTFFYVPNGHMYLDMTPEGVHSNRGGLLPRAASCWE